MMVHYYEGSALTHSGNAPGREVTLEDRHKTAWRLFSGADHYPGQHRDFIFRADRLSDSQELYRLRSPMPFGQATPHEIDLSEGRKMVIEWVMTPLISVKDPGRPGRGKRRQAPRERWLEVAKGTIERRGMAMESADIKIDHVAHLRQFNAQKARCNLLRCQASVMVTDPLKAASAWLSGTAKMRAYGMGMITLMKGAPHD